MSSRVLIGIFDNEEATLAAVRDSREHGYRVVDVHTPYAIHGMEDAMGLGPSRIPWVVFALALLGAGLKVWFEFWSTAVDWPINVGGKPYNSLPAFVPVTFEVMVLFAAVGAVFSFFAVCRLFPGRKAELPIPGVTDNRFAVILEESDSTFDPALVEAMFRARGAVDVTEQVVPEVA